MPGPYAMEDERTLGQIVRYEDRSGTPKNPSGWDGSLKMIGGMLASVGLGYLTSWWWIALVGTFAALLWFIFSLVRHANHGYREVQRENRIQEASKPLSEMVDALVDEDPKTLSTGVCLIPISIEVKRFQFRKDWEDRLLHGPTDFNGIKKWILEQFPEDREAARFALRKAQFASPSYVHRTALSVLRENRDSKCLKNFECWMSDYKTKNSQYRFFDEPERTRSEEDAEMGSRKVQVTPFGSYHEVSIF